MSEVKQKDDANNTAYLGVIVSATARDRLEALAKQQETTTSALVRTAIRDYLAKPENKEC